jgi:hypothetical protein
VDVVCSSWVCYGLANEARELQVVENPSSVEAPSRETILTDPVNDDPVALHVAVRLLVGEAEHLADCHVSVVLHVGNKVSRIWCLVNTSAQIFLETSFVPIAWKITVGTLLARIF